MLIIPAIDLKDGRCVRLQQGRMESATVFSDDPVAMAKHWAAQGARRLHIVDLNGAIAGRPKNDKVIRDMIRAVGEAMPIQIGGGIRDLDTIESYIDAGVTYVIIGTAAVKNPGFLSDASRFYFVHSYYPAPADPAVVAATCVYGAPFTCAVARDNIFAVQFHPEKSQSAGLRLLSNFVHWRP